MRGTPDSITISNDNGWQVPLLQ